MLDKATASEGEEMLTLKRTAWMALVWTCAATISQAASMTIPAGTTLAVRMSGEIDSERSQAGEMFRATIDGPVTINGQVVLPAGAEAIGRLTAVTQPGRFRGRSTITMELTALNFDGRSVGILTAVYQESGAARGKQTAAMSGGGGALGSILGAIAGGPPGMLIGAGLGAAGGAVLNVVRGPQAVRIPAESLMLFTLLSPVTIEMEY
jgi:hypothetical protein